MGWLATSMDKTAVCRLVRIDWDTVGRMVTRVMRDGVDPARLEGLFEIGVEEVSWRRRHKDLTVVTDHRRGQVVWGAEGRDSRRGISCQARSRSHFSARRGGRPRCGMVHCASRSARRLDSSLALAVGPARWPCRQVTRREEPAFKV